VPLPKALSKAVYIRDQWKCRHCSDRNGLHPHHVIKQSHQGPDEMTNLITLCAGCHRAHHDGHLKITAGGKTVNNIYVIFERVRKWKPGM
jgi:5-methylcytosine-specific restriction endonuclease McrA